MLKLIKPEIGQLEYRQKLIADSDTMAYNVKWGEYIVNIIIEHKHRGKGYGREGLRLLMDAAKANGVEKLCDDIAADNPSIALFKEMGFSEEWRNDDAVMMAKTL